MPDLHVRAATSADAAAIVEVNNAAVPAVNELTTTDVAWFLDHAHQVRVACRRDGSLVALLVVLTGPGAGYASENYGWFSDRFESFLYVDRIVIAPGAQRGGLGRSLYETLIDEGRDRFPVLCAEVNTRPRNERSLQFHAELGFERVGERRGADKDLAMLARPLESRR